MRNTAPLSTRSPEDLRTEALAERARALTMRSQGNHEAAIGAYESATQIARLTNDPGFVAQIQIGLIDSLGVTGQTEAALTLGHRLEAELLAQNLGLDAAKVAVNIGTLYMRTDRYPAALTCFERALPVFLDSNDPLALARVQANIATLLIYQNRLEEAQPLFTEARTAFVTGEALLLAAMVGANEGFLHYLAGRHSQALALMTRARETFARENQVTETARCDADMADIYRELNLLPEAQACYGRAIGVFAEIPLPYEQARAELGLAGVYRESNRLESGYASLDRAEALFRQQKNTLMGAWVQLMRTELLLDQGRQDEAVQEARRAERRFARNGAQGWAAEARFLVVRGAQARGQNVSRQIRSISRIALREGRRWLHCRAENLLGAFYAERGNTARALRHLRTSVEALETLRLPISSEELHISFLQNKQSIYESLIGLLLQRGRRTDVVEALETVERSRSRLLLERIQSTFDRSPQTLPPADRDRLASLRAELNRAYYRENNFDAGSPQRRIELQVKDDVDLKILEQAYRTALRDIEIRTETAPLEGFEGGEVSSASLQTTLRKDETLVEFYAVNGEIGAFILTGKEVRFLNSLCSEAEASHLARRLRYHLHRIEMQGPYVHRHADQLHHAIQNVLHALHAQLWEPILPWLQTEKVVVVPHGCLHGVPFHAFYDGERYALDRHEFLYAPSAAIWREGVSSTPSAATKGALLMGVPGPGIEQVREEIRQLSETLPDAIALYDQEATVAAFLESAPGCRYLHLATHALFREDNPLFSGLQFSDGWLLARDLYDLRLDCDLATLSACRTGVTCVEPGDELFGLIRGFLSAGAHALAVSLWPADDSATADLMVILYTALMQGESRASALRRAQQETRSRYPHPYHWAAFALIGAR